MSPHCLQLRILAFRHSCVHSVYVNIYRTCLKKISHFFAPFQIASCSVTLQSSVLRFVYTRILAPGRVEIQVVWDELREHNLLSSKGRKDFQMKCGGNDVSRHQLMVFGTEPKCLTVSKNLKPVTVNSGVWDRAQMSECVFTSRQTKQTSMNQTSDKMDTSKKKVLTVIETCPILLRLYKYGALSVSNPNVSKTHKDVLYKTHPNHYFTTFCTKHTNLGLYLNSQKHTSTNWGHSLVWNATQHHLLFQPLILALCSVYFYRGVKKKKERESRAGREGQSLPLGGYIWAVTLYLAHTWWPVSEREGVCLSLSTNDMT